MSQHSRDPADRAQYGNLQQFSHQSGASRGRHATIRVAHRNVESFTGKIPALLASKAEYQAVVQARGKNQLNMHLNLERTDEADSPRDEDVLAVSAHCGDALNL